MEGLWEGGREVGGRDRDRGEGFDSLGFRVGYGWVYRMALERGF